MESDADCASSRDLTHATHRVMWHYVLKNVNLLGYTIYIAARSRCDDHSALDKTIARATPEQHTTNMVERVNREIKRRTRVVSVFSDAESVLRLVGIEVVEQDREWSLKRSYFTKKSMDEARESS